MSLRFLKKEPFRGVHRTLSNAYDEVFFAEVVNVFQQLFPQKSSTIAVRHNPKYVSHIFPTIFTAVLLVCLKQTCQVFRTAIFQDVSEDLILSYDLISFSLLFIWDITIITSFGGNLKIS